MRRAQFHLGDLKPWPAPWRPPPRQGTTEVAHRPGRPDRAQPELRRLAAALGDALPPCSGQPELWWPEDRQTAEQAIDTCVECPGMLPCDSLATALGATAGVWGGRHRKRVDQRKREPQ